VGEVLAQELVRKGLVQDAADLFTLTVDKLVPPAEATDAVRIERMAKKSAENLVAAIARARDSATLSRLLIGLGIPHVGTVAAQAIAARFASLDAFADAPAAERRQMVATIDGVGEVIADAVATYMDDPVHVELLGRFRARGLSPHEPIAAPVTDGPLAGKRVCVTGKLSRARSDIQKDIEAAGGKFVSAVGKTTDILVAGEDVGKSKLDAARKLGTQIIDEPGLEAILRGGPLPDPDLRA
jgi:DNA ligase (NAD+)